MGLKCQLKYDSVFHNLVTNVPKEFHSNQIKTEFWIFTIWLWLWVIFKMLSIFHYLADQKKSAHLQEYFFFFKFCTSEVWLIAPGDSKLITNQYKKYYLK